MRCFLWQIVTLGDAPSKRDLEANKADQDAHQSGEKHPERILSETQIKETANNNIDGV